MTWFNVCMSSQDKTSPSAEKGTKREYRPPKLETLGTIDDLTRGAGKETTTDGVHPPGLNKSIM